MALEQVELRGPARARRPTALAGICATDTHARASHALGKSYWDVVRGFRGRFEHPPDFVACPREETDVERVLEWCSAERVAVVPYGGGTSVVGGVEPRVGPQYNGAVSLDLCALDRVLEVDAVSRAARIQAGASGPVLEAQLADARPDAAPLPAVLRALPRSGGWIATRAAGHFATVWTHIEDFVESVRAITPAGTGQSRRLPGSGAGPSPDRMLVGSEGTLGVITEAWVRVQPRPTHRASAGVRFATFVAGAECVRALSQSGLHPSNCRLIDPSEARLTLAGDGIVRAAGAWLRVLRPRGRRAAGPRACDLRRARRRGGRAAGERSRRLGRRSGGGEGAAAAGPRRARAGQAASGPGAKRFCARPTCATSFVAMGVLSETFETAITWDRFPALSRARMAAAHAAADGRRAGRRGSRAASPTSTPTDRPPTTRCWPRRAAAKRSSSGRRSRAPSRMR